MKLQRGYLLVPPYTIGAYLCGNSVARLSQEVVLGIPEVL